MRRPNNILVVLVCVAWSLSALAADFWADKSYQTWSAEQTQQMMKESPWATTLTIGTIQANVTFTDTPNNHSNHEEMEDNPTISYTLQFRSARPIREAQVRAQQLNVHYDKMTADQKAAFDANAGKFLDATFPDRVLVSVTFHANVLNYQSLLRNYWTEQSTAKLSMKVFLYTNDERLSLTNYSFKDETFQFTFPRPKELPRNGKISVEFVHPTIEAIHEQRIVQVFSLKKMLVNGEPAV